MAILIELLGAVFARASLMRRPACPIRADVRLDEDSSARLIGRVIVVGVLSGS